MYVYGKNVIKELINNNKKINKAIIYKEFTDKDTILSLEKHNISINYVDKRELDRLVDGNHQGIIAVVDDYQYCDIDEMIDSIEKEYPFVIMLDHLEDPHNLGAIIRTAEAAGVDGIIIPKDRGVDVNSTVMKTSVGALDYIKVAKVTNLNMTIKDLKKKGFWIIGTDMDGTDYKSNDYNMPVCLVIGSEGNGLSRLVKEACDLIVSIPMRGQINSLNASVAAGVMIYEIIRKHGK